MLNYLEYSNFDINNNDNVSNFSVRRLTVISTYKYIKDDNIVKSEA